MNDFALMMPAYLDQRADREGDWLIAMSAWLARTPCNPIGMGSPRDAATAALLGDGFASL